MGMLLTMSLQRRSSIVWSIVSIRERARLKKPGAFVVRDGSERLQAQSGEARRLAAALSVADHQANTCQHDGATSERPDHG